MIKGTSRRVIVVKNPKTDMFDEAYFIVKEGKMKRKKDHKSLVFEAAKMLEESGRKTKKTGGKIATILSFFCGALASAVIFYIISV